VHADPDGYAEVLGNASKLFVVPETSAFRETSIDLPSRSLPHRVALLQVGIPATNAQ
jgi:hypothetical protein